MTVAISTQRLSLKPIVKTRDFLNHAHHLLAPITRNKVRAQIVDLNHFLLLLRFRRNNMMLIQGKMRTYRTNQGTHLRLIRITLGSIKVIHQSASVVKECSTGTTPTATCSTKQHTFNPAVQERTYRDQVVYLVEKLSITCRTHSTLKTYKCRSTLAP
jgi:hypothetical protein